MELIDRRHPLGEEPHASSLDEGEGDDRPVNTLTAHNRRIDFRGIGRLADEQLSLQASLEHRSIGRIGLDGSKARVYTEHVTLFGRLCWCRVGMCRIT